MTEASADAAHPPGGQPRISYGQNGEDVRLWRALDGIDEGRYVEVGAWDPERDSISYSFYQRGWSGVIVEPVAEFAQAFLERRPRDCVAQCLAGDVPGTTQFTVFPGTGLSTTVRQFADRHVADGLEHRETTAEVRRLDDILDGCSIGPEIHFMTVDVEGAEHAVLRGIDLSRYRPWILVVESTEPRSTVKSMAWKPHLLDQGYREVVSDGLNAYFVAAEHDDLGDLLVEPPNALDNFRTYELAAALEESSGLHRDLAAAREELDDWRSRCDSLATALHEARSESDELRGTVGRLEAKLEALRSSASWRITAPLRKVRGWKRRP